MDQEANLERGDQEENLEQMERMERLDLKVFKDFLVQWVLLETRVLLESLVKKAILVFLECQVPEEMLAKMELMDPLDPLDHQVLLGKEDLQDPVVQGDSKECLALLENLVSQGKMARLGFLGSQV